VAAEPCRESTKFLCIPRWAELMRSARWRPQEREVTAARDHMSTRLAMGA